MADRSDPNRTTLDSYDNAPERYEQKTPEAVDGVVAEWLDSLLAVLPPSASMLEIGSGTGRDALYIEQRGARVVRTEASEGLRKRLAAQGLRVDKLDVLTDEIPRGYDVVLANAVLHHFTPDQVRAVLANVKRSLAYGALFAFTVKEGSGESWESEKLGSPRYFCRWNTSTLSTELSDAGFDIRQLAGEVVSDNGERWVHAVVAPNWH